MRILGAGLSKTGTTSLADAVRLLGFTCINYDQERLTPLLLGRVRAPDFRVYDDVDAVFDIPSAYFYRELLTAYPEAKAILTVRDVETWWKSIKAHFNEARPLRQPRPSEHVKAILRGRERLQAHLDDLAFRTALRNCVYGSIEPREYLFKKRYIEHNQRVIGEVDADRLLVIDVTAGQGWRELCAFLGVPEPDAPFPHSNVTRVGALS
jgi:Sulfotransferase domain